MSKDIFFGSLQADKLFFGTQEVNKVYFGNILVWEAASAPQIDAPTLTQYGMDIVITDNSEGRVAESFNIYVDDVLVDNIEANDYVYSVRDGVLTIYDAPYAQDNDTVIIGEERVTDLNGTVWYFNSPMVSALDEETIGTYRSINFTSNSESFTGIECYYEMSMSLDFNLLYQTEGPPNLVLNSVTWPDETYRTISITGGVDATSSDLINWLYENATLQS